MEKPENLLHGDRVRAAYSDPLSRFGTVKSVSFASKVTEGGVFVQWDDDPVPSAVRFVHFDIARQAHFTLA